MRRRLFLCLVKSFHIVLWVLYSITKTLQAAYLLKTGGRERVKKVSPSSVSFLVHRLALLKPHELWFLPLRHPCQSNPLRPTLPLLRLIGQASKFAP